MVEQNYCPLQRETLLHVFGCSKLNQYLYDKRFVEESDQKSLKSKDTTPNANDLSRPRLGKKAAEYQSSLQVYPLISNFPISRKRVFIYSLFYIDNYRT